jgi:threonine aldolase
MCGAMLLGDSDFIKEARIWMRRFGGNLFTALPYAVADLDAYNKLKDSFGGRLEAAKTIASVVTACDATKSMVKFVPDIPQCSLVHCHMKATTEQALAARDAVVQQLNVRVFRVIRGSYIDGYVYFEWNFGPVNITIPTTTYSEAWTLFFNELARIQSA